MVIELTKRLNDAAIHRKRTRLEMEDVAMWQRMGLDIGPDGRFRGGGEDNTSQSRMTFGGGSDRIDLVSNTLVWMLAKLVNLIATVDSEAEPSSPEALADNTTFLHGWLSMKEELQAWFDSLPPLFHPCSQVPLQLSTHSGRDSMEDCRCRSRSLIDHETWHSDSMCSSTMQSYHMSQILILLHKPPSISVRQLQSPLTPSSPELSRSQHLVTSQGSGAGGKSFSDTISDMNRMSEILRYHAVEICAIALSRPEEAARIHMLQPLYYAGRCLTDTSDRRVVVQLLDSIEDELGWHAKYRVDSLLAEWNISRDSLDCHHHHHAPQ